MGSSSKGGLFKIGADFEFLRKSVFVSDLIKMEVQSLNILRARHGIEKKRKKKEEKNEKTKRKEIEKKKERKEGRKEE